MPEGESSLDRDRRRRGYVREVLPFPMGIPNHLACGGLTSLAAPLKVVPKHLTAVVSNVALVHVEGPRSLFHISTADSKESRDVTIRLFR